MNYSETDQGKALIGDILDLIPAPEDNATASLVRELVGIHVDRAYLDGRISVVDEDIQRTKAKLRELGAPVPA